MAKIAKAAGTENQVVGKVFILYGTVQAVSPDGTVRVLAPNSPIYADEHIITGSDGSVSIQFDGPPVTQLDLGRMTEIVIDEDVYAGVTPEAVSEVCGRGRAGSAIPPGGGSADRTGGYCRGRFHRVRVAAILSSFSPWTATRAILQAARIRQAPIPPPRQAQPAVFSTWACRAFRW